MRKSKLIAVTAFLTAVLLIGIVFICVGQGTIAKDKKYTENAECRVALISSVLQSDGNRKYILWYNVDGVNYEPEYDFNKENGDYIGKDIKVYFTEGSPEKIFIKTSEVFYVLLYMGIALTVLSAFLLGIIHIPLAIREYIIKNGTTELVKINEAVDVIGGQKLLCDSTKIRGKRAEPFKSKKIKSKITKDMLNSAVTVYYLPEHKNFYYIDTSTIKYREENK